MSCSLPAARRTGWPKAPAWRRRPGAAIIDINMGCPAKHVTNGESGSALMRDLDHAVSLIEATIAAVSVPVTLKMRLGWDWRSINAPELGAPRRAGRHPSHHRARPHPLSVLHGRADWAAVRAVKQRRDDSRRGQRRHSQRRRRRCRVCCLRRRRHHGRPRRPGPARGFPASLRLSGDRPAASKKIRRSTRSALMAAALYEDMLAHHGIAIGRRHARKHLGWALEAAAASAAVPADILKSHRSPRADRRCSRRRPRPSRRGF